MNDYLLEVYDHIPNEYRSVYLYLVQRAQTDAKLGMTQQEISRFTRLSVLAVREALGWLESPVTFDATRPKQVPEIAGFIKTAPSGKRHKITLLTPYVDDSTDIPFTFEDKDQQRIATLEKEVMRLSSIKKQPKKLSSFLKGDRAQIISEIERDLGRNLSLDEAFMLGAVVMGFGPERLKGAWRTKAHQMKKPVRDIYSMFMNQAFGKPVAKEEHKDISYRKLGKGDE